MLSAPRWSRLAPVGALVFVSLMGPAPATAQPAPRTEAGEAAPPLPQPDPAPANGVAAEAARLYLGQSLFALTTALRYARHAGQVGPTPGFDVAKFLRELDLVTRGVERYLRPGGPVPAPAVPVEITGQFLQDQLDRVVPGRRTAP
jgi:hypothetical protein